MNAGGPTIVLILAAAAGLVLLPGAPGSAEPPAAPDSAEQAEVISPPPGAIESDNFVRSPDSVANPVPETGLLERVYPQLTEQRRRLPAFFADTQFQLHFRSFYFNRENDDDTASEAWTLGGWVRYESGWLLDTFAIGAAYYTSLPAYAPADRPGSLLLTPGQGEIGVVAEAWAALRYKDYAILRGYRQRIDEGYVNPQDNRMLPNTFEALMLSGQVGWAQYDVGYIWDIKPRDSNDFISMSKQAGALGKNEGLLLTALTLTPIKDLSLYAANYNVANVFNTAFGKAEYTHKLSEDLALQFGIQYTDQRSVGHARLGNFSTWNIGGGGRVLWRGLRVGAAMHKTSDNASIRTPYGTWPGYLSLQVTEFDRAGELAYGLGVRYDFGGTLLPFQIPGLSVYMIYAAGRDRVDPPTGAGLPDTHEGDLDIVYNVPAVKGLSLRFRNAYIGRGGGKLVKDFRLIVNYELDLF